MDVHEDSCDGCPKIKLEGSANETEIQQKQDSIQGCKKRNRARLRKPEKPKRSASYYKCSYCEYTTQIHSEHLNHEYNHLHQQQFNTDLEKTGSEFINNPAMRIEQIYKCKECQSAKQAKDLEAHVKSHSRSKPKTHKCSHCDYAGSTANKLKSHLRVHSKEKPLKCELCDYACKHRARLKEHMWVHNGIKPYKCPYCDHTASSHANLRRHRATHTGVKPHKCMICDYTCFRPSDLRLHMRKHTGEKPFSCVLCDFSASSHSNLRRHLSVHTGYKPHSCDMCEYRCTNRSRLAEHMHKHTGEKPFSCTYCGYKCVQSSKMNTHVKCKHPEKLSDGKDLEEYNLLPNGIHFSSSLVSFRNVDRMKCSEMGNKESSNNDLPDVKHEVLKRYV